MPELMVLARSVRMGRNRIVLAQHAPRVLQGMLVSMESAKHVWLAHSQTMAPPRVKRALRALQELLGPALDVHLAPSRPQHSMNATPVQTSLLAPMVRATSATMASSRTVQKQPANHVHWDTQARPDHAQHVH